MKLKQLGATLLWSRGNDGALLLIAVLAWLNAFGGPTGGFLRDAERFWLSPSFWVGVGSMVLALIVIYGRWRHGLAAQWLGAGERVAVVPSLANPPGSYQWWNEVSPRHPLISTEDDAAQQMLIAACTACFIGLVAGYASCEPTDKRILIITLISGVCFAFAGGAYAWNMYGEKGRHLLWVETYRQAYLTPSADGSLDFVVVSKLSETSLGGVVLVRMPWSAVTVFDSGSYWRSFGLSVRSGHDDWNVIKMTPLVGQPVLVTETFHADARLYDLITSLTEKFGPAARSHYERDRRRNSSPAQSQERGPQSPGSDVPARFE